MFLYPLSNPRLFKSKDEILQCTKLKTLTKEILPNFLETPKGGGLQSADKLSSYDGKTNYNHDSNANTTESI